MDPQIEKIPDQAPALGGSIDLVNAQYGAELINCGALVEGLRAWAKVEEWGDEEIGLITRALDPYRLVNAVAEHLEDIAVGDLLALAREPDNPFDANAIKVTTLKGQTLGYIRLTIARKLVARIERGASLQGKVALVVGDRFGPNDRAYIEVKVQ